MTLDRDHAPSLPRRTTLHDQTLVARARAIWVEGRSNTHGIAKKLGLSEAEVCRVLVRPGERRE